MTGPLKVQKHVLWFVIFSPYLDNFVKDLFYIVCAQTAFIFHGSLASWLHDDTQLNHWSGQCRRCWFALSQQCVCMLLVVLLPASHPLCNRRWADRKQLNLPHSLLGALWQSVASVNTLPRVLKTCCVSTVRDERMQTTSSTGRN